MTWLRRWVANHPKIASYLEGAGMVWVPLPPPSARSLYIKSDFMALATDWRAIAADLSGTMDKAGADGRSGR